MRELDVLVVDPSIISGDGHHYPYLNQHRIEFGKLQIAVHAFASASIDRDFATQTGLIPAFRTSLHARSAYTREEFHEFSANFEQDLRQAVRKYRLRPEYHPSADRRPVHDPLLGRLHRKEPPQAGSVALDRDRTASPEAPPDDP